MSDFDFFGEGEEKKEEVKPNELELTFDFDYENVLNDGNEKNVKLCATIRPSDELRRNFENSGNSQSAHICLLIDVSDSMALIVDNSNAIRTGEKVVGEDGREYNVVKGGISKLHIAVQSAKKVVELMREGDTLSCITYSDDAQVLFHDLRVVNKDEIYARLDGLLHHYGMNTNISKALSLAGKLLLKYEDVMPKRILFFTDGTPTGDDNEKNGVKIGKKLAEYNISVESMGFGKDDVNFPYLQRISSFSGGVTSLISYPDAFAEVFSSVFAKAQSTVVTNVKLVFRLTPGVKIRDYYRGTPDNVFLGNRSDSEERVFEINVGQIEKNQMYKYYFNVDIPGAEDNYTGAYNLMNVELHYCVPGKYNNEEQGIKKNVPVNFTNDPNRADEINGVVNVLFRLAEVKRFDEEREKAYIDGDVERTIQLILKIIEVYKELQKPVEARAYSDMLEEYRKTNKISKAVLNKATSSSSQAQETGILEELDSAEKSRFAERLKNRRRR